MIEIIIYACLAANPNQCEQITVMSPTIAATEEQCIAKGKSLVKTWQILNPDRKIKTFTGGCITKKNNGSKGQEI